MKNVNICFYTLLGVLFSSCTKRNVENPNIIFILNDDHRFDALGCMDNNSIKTPNMDLLAHHGVLFTNACATTPISCVSRASILTGQYASNHKIFDFDTPLTEQQFSLMYPALLKKSGYYVGFIGKYGVGKYSTYPSKSFDFWRSFPNQGWYYKNDSLRRRHLPEKYSIDEDIHLTSMQGRQICEFLQSRDKSKPFCLSVSFKAPHCQDEMRIQGGDEFPIDRRDSLLYSNIKFNKPKTSTDSFYYALPESFRYSKEKQKENEARVRWKWRFSSDSLYQKTVEKYYSLIFGVDREIGNMMNELKRQGLDKNTIIIVMGDNGFYLGEHGLAGKWFAHEPSIRIPLIIYDPRVSKERKGIKSSAMALNIDICPTILDLAGVDIPDIVDGKSLKPILNGDNDDIRKDFFIEYNFNPKNIHLPSMEGLVTPSYKLIRYYVEENEWWELYNRKKDSLEINNLIEDNYFRSIVDTMKVRMNEVKSKL